MPTDTLATRLFTEAEARAEANRAEYEARQDAILRRYDRHPALRQETWASALDDLWRLVFMGLAWLVATSLLMWVAL